MTFMSQAIDVLAQGSDRPLRRLLAYYAIVGIIVLGLTLLSPGLMLLIAGKGLRAVSGSEQVLEDGLSAAGPIVRGLGPGSLSELAAPCRIPESRWLRDRWSDRS